MSESCPRILQKCESQEIATGKYSCPDWSVCLPWGGKLYQVEGCVRYEPGTPPPDGVYGLFTIKDGCIVSAEEEPVSVYHPDPCAPIPCPCDSGEGGDSNLCNPSTAAGNLYTCDASGKPLVRLNVQSGDNISVTGNGTALNPLTISANLGDAGVMSITSGSDALIVSPTTGAVEIQHKLGYNDQTIMGMTFDQYGHLTGYSEQAASGITGIVPGNGIEVNVDNSSKIATISLSAPANNLNGEYNIGGYLLNLDTNNRIFNLTRRIEDTAGTLVWGQYNVTLDDYGSIESYELLPDPGTLIHGFYTTTNEAIVRRNLTFTLRYSSPMLVDIEVMAPEGWGDQLQLRVDGAPMSNVMVLTPEKTEETAGGSEPSEPGTGESTTKQYTHVRLIPSGVYQAGQHELTIHSPAGFPLEEVMSVSIRPMQNFDASTAQTAEDITE